MNKYNISHITRFTALALAFFVLVSSVSYVVDMHFCQGQLKSVNFFGKAKACHEVTEAAPMKNCPHHAKMTTQNEGSTMDKKDCCSNQTFHFQSDQDKQVQISDIAFNQQLQQFVIAYVAVILNNDFDIDSDAVSYAHYKPPLIARDISVLFESFLI